MPGRFVRTFAVLAFLTVLPPFHAFAAEPSHKAFHRQTEQSEIRAILMKRIEEGWALPANLPGADRVRVEALLTLDRSGGLIGDPRVVATGGPQETRRALVASVYRAILRAVPFQGLPKDRYDDWRHVAVNFKAIDPAL